MLDGRGLSTAYFRLKELYCEDGVLLWLLFGTERASLPFLRIE